MRFFAAVLATFSLMAPLSGQNADLAKLFKDYYETGLRLGPEGATFVGRTEYNDRWTDWSLKGIADEKRTMQDFQKRLAPFQNARLNEQERLSVELLDYEIRTELERLDRTRTFSVVNHFSDLIFTFPAQWRRCRRTRQRTSRIGSPVFAPFRNWWTDSLSQRTRLAAGISSGPGCSAATAPAARNTKGSDR